MRDIIHSALSYLTRFDTLSAEAAETRIHDFADAAGDIARDVGQTDLLDLLNSDDPALRRGSLASAGLRYQGVVLKPLAGSNRKCAYALAYVFLAGFQETAPGMETSAALFLRRYARLQGRRSSRVESGSGRGK